MILRRLPALLALLSFFSFFALSSLANDGFVPGIDDLPLMPGLVAQEEEGVIFDKPGGRIVEAVARGRLARPDVQSFYGETLTQLGWTRIADGRFGRDGEVLAIAFESAGDVLTVRFTLSPE